jgi:hypothetical protein
VTQTRQERGYDAEYDAVRRDWERRIAAGELVLCWRCLEEHGTETVLTTATPWDLGHDDHDRTIIRGPECRGPNRATSSRRPTGRRQPEQHPAERALAALQRP